MVESLEGGINKSSTLEAKLDGDMATIGAVIPALENVFVSEAGQVSLRNSGGVLVCTLSTESGHILREGNIGDWDKEEIVGGLAQKGISLTIRLDSIDNGEKVLLFIMTPKVHEVI